MTGKGAWKTVAQRPTATRTKSRPPSSRPPKRRLLKPGLYPIKSKTGDKPPVFFWPSAGANRVHSPTPQALAQGQRDQEIETIFLESVFPVRLELNAHPHRDKLNFYDTVLY
jgi:hypothetical protein